MLAVNRHKFYFFIVVASLVSCLEIFASASECSKEALLREECNYSKAIQKRDCLKAQIAKFKNCEQKIKDLDRDLAVKITKKSNAVIDPLRVEKALHTQKLYEFRKILERHHIEVKFTATTFVSFVKNFNEYRSSEIEIQKKLKKIFESASECENHLHLVGIRFSAEMLLREEQAKSSRMIQSSPIFVSEFQEKANSLQNRFVEYREFIDKKNLKDSIPTYDKEITFSRGVEKYTVDRIGKLENSIRALVQEINAKMAVLQKKKINADQEKDFKLANDISKEFQFYNYVSQLIQDAFLRTERSNYQSFEFYGARFKGVQKFMTLAAICTADSLNQPQNEWLGLGCKRYEEYLPHATKSLAIRYAKNIKLVLTNISWDKPDLKESKEILDALNHGNLERAIELYDQLLVDLGNNTVKP